MSHAMVCTTSSPFVCSQIDGELESSFPLWRPRRGLIRAALKCGVQFVHRLDIFLRSETSNSNQCKKNT